MEISIEKVSNVNIIISIIGQLDMYSAGELRKEFTTCVEDGAKNVLLDCSQMDYIDSSGVGAFILLLQLLKNHSGSHALFGLNELPTKVFTMSNIIRLLHVFPDKSQAERAIFS